MNNKPPWLVTPEKFQAVVQQLIKAGKRRKRYSLGSYIRGEVTRDSDWQVLVVAGDEEKNTTEEAVRLRSAVEKY